MVNISVHLGYRSHSKIKTGIAYRFLNHSVCTHVISSLVHVRPVCIFRSS